jgi:DNA gyrase subunit A
MASADVIGGGNVEPRALEEEMRTAYLDYAMSVIVGRALPDVRDGLKPVHRRVLYAMNELGLGPTRSYAKCAKIVGEVMGNYHPHGDSAIYDTLVRMAQEFSMRNELVDGQGNFGSIDDDPAAAMRYCVTGDTRVRTGAGTVRIDSLALGAIPSSDTPVDVEVLDRLGRPVHASILFHSGEHPTLRLRTTEGYELTGTANHPVLCLVELAGVPLLLWRLLGELRPGERVVMNARALAEDRAAMAAPRPAVDERLGTGQISAASTAVLEKLGKDIPALLEPLQSGDYYYAEVASIDPAGVQPVYSLRVDTDDHSFLTNGFISHNTEARLARIATEMLRDLDMDTVDFAPNYDGSRREPLVLPARFPNLLVNGSSGIAVGMATNIPPHNLREVIDATIAYIDDPELEVEGLMRHIKGPDFPTGGIILGRAGIKDAYETGRGRVRIQARAHIEPLKQGKEAIVVTELPFMVKKGGPGGLIEKIAELVREKKIPEISDLNDYSDKRGMRLMIELKRDAIPKVVLNKLYKHTPMQSTFGVNMVALVDNVPRTLNLRAVIHNYVAHQREVIVRRTKHELSEKEARAHILEGLLTALEHLDAIIELIRGSRDRDNAREQLIARFELSPIQATAILDLRLSQLTALEADGIKQEHADVTERIAELRAILGDESRVLAVIKEELSEIRERFGDERRSEITHSEDEIDIEDLIADQQMVITITQTGYIKSLPLATYRQQQRGGRGVTGMDMKDGDFIEHLFVCSSHDYLLFFSNRGKVYRSKVYELPEAQRTAKGRALVNILPLREGERIQAVLSTRDFTETKYLVFATRNGTVKKTELLAYNTPMKADGIIAINIRDDDELLAVRAVDPEDEVIMTSRAGLTVRFAESDARSMGRDTTGVRGMDVGKGGKVIAMDVARDDMDLLVVTENGYGKRTRIDQYRKTHRGAKGVKTIGLTEKKGGLAGALVVREHHELVFISVGGMVQRTSAGGISQQGRSATGVRVMNLKEDDVVSAIALVVDSVEPSDEPAESTDTDVLTDEPTAVAPVAPVAGAESTEVIEDQ